MLLKTLLGLLCGVGALATADSSPQPGPAPHPPPSSSPPPLLVVSFDGFRADYMQRFPMTNLKLLYSQGVLVEQLTNVFVTKTFPNHYSLMTGLYAESHGIIASHMYDAANKKTFEVGREHNPVWWNAARPLWVTAQDSGYKTAAMMWPGSDLAIGNRTATHFLPYDKKMTFRERLWKVINWMLGNGKEPGVMFAVLYWEEPDRSGHIFGPDNYTVMSEVLKEVDDNIGLLVSELKRTYLWGRINLLVTSDHGMAQCSADRLIQLDNCVHPDSYTLVDLTPVTAILPQKDPEAIFALLKNCHAHMTAYLKSTIPERLHYRNNKLIQPIILIADEGWTIVQRGNKLPRLGDHGYDNSLPSMHPFMAAVGPSFRKGFRMSSLRSVDIYPLMCHLLSVPPQPNNGTLNRARCLLAAEVCWDVPVVYGMVACVILVILGIIAAFTFLSRCHLSRPRPFQRLLVDDCSDHEVLLE